MTTIQGILDTNHIVKVQPHDTLSSALSKLSSSHGAAFVFDNKKQLLGVINPYYCLIKSSLPGNAKVEHSLFHPPRLHIHTSLEQAASQMIGSKVHYLPVFNDANEFQGVISARAILAAFQNHPKLKMSIKDLLVFKNKPLITVYEDDMVATAVNLFKTYRISKLIVVSKDFKLKGVVSYYDIIHFLISPKQKPDMTVGNKDHIDHQKVSRFAKAYVLTLNQNDPIKRALQLVLEKKIGSIVIVDDQKHPVGILTTRDFFNLILQKSHRLRFQLFDVNLSQKSQQTVEQFLKPFYTFLTKVPNFSQASLTVKEEKNGGLFKVLFSVLPQKGKQTTLKKEGKNLKVLLNEVKEGVRNRRSRS